MRLPDHLSALSADRSHSGDPELRALMAETTAALAASGIAERALSVGERAPDFVLCDAFGQPIRLYSLLRHGPIVLSFYRGHWCPYCSAELRALEQVLLRVERAGARLLAVSPQLPGNGLTTAERNALSFSLLSDPGLKAAKRYGLVYTLNAKLRKAYQAMGIDLPTINGDRLWRLPLPATYIIGHDRHIRYAFVNADYTQRAEPSDFIATLLT